MSKKQKQNTKEERDRQTATNIFFRTRFLTFVQAMEEEQRRPVPHAFDELNNLFGMNKADTIAFAERIVGLLQEAKREEEEEEEHSEIWEEVASLYNQKRSQGELRKAALSSSGFLTHREAFDAMGAGFGNHAKSIKQTYGPSGSTAAGSTAVVNQENTPSWWQQKREEEQQRQEQMEIHSVPYRTDKRGNPGEERRLAATRIQAIHRRKSSAKKEQKLREEQQQKKGGRKSRGRRRSRKKRKSRKPKKRRKRNKRKSRKR